MNFKIHVFYHVVVAIPFFHMAQRYDGIGQAAHLSIFFSLCCPDVISIVSTYTNYKMIIGFCGKKHEFYVSAKISPSNFS